MATATLNHWKPGMDLPYVVSLEDGGMLAVSLRAKWLKADKSGQPILLPPAVRALDRLRAVFANQRVMTPDFIVSLREAMGLSQSDFGKKLGVSNMTVSRWECGRMGPSAKSASAILALQAKAQREGVKIDGEKLTSGSAARV